MQTSIEVEYWVVDSDGDLTEPGPLADVSTRTERASVEPLLAVKTPSCESISELRTALAKELEGVLSRASTLDKRLVPFATPINGDVTDRRTDGQERIRTAVIGERVDCAKYCAGAGIHIEQRNVTDQLNTLLALDPALALVNSSPYVRGDRIANGARSRCHRTENGEAFPKRGRRWRYVETVGEWYRWLERRYEGFRDAAVSAGVDAATVEESVSPDDVGWTPVRLHESMSTIEWRSPDAALPSQLLRLVDDLETMLDRLHRTTVRIDGVNEGAAGNWTSDDGDGWTSDDGIGYRYGGPTARPGHITGDGITLPAFETVSELTESAIRDGIESPAVANYLERMGFSVGDYHPISTRIDGRQYVTRADARDLRLEYASRFEEDVDKLSGTDG
ncbi:glutamate--cysteine ligase [Natrinema sp. CBA1119]|uniref:hypothetical protein n=1 Tax=Natrinema sp. CBA1119 TaxID=1608465 RepID=UPI000BF2B7E1|nr:hypothetical protein [Natrinema sp. CBA1119]PGF16095.1 glutamate--cysteine ligase [Natrinema sp. CBA1119]